MSARLHIRIACDSADCIASFTQDTPHRTLARRRADEQGWDCDPRGLGDHCPTHRLPAGAKEGAAPARGGTSTRGTPAAGRPAPGQAGTPSFGDSGSPAAAQPADLDPAGELRQAIAP